MNKVAKFSKVSFEQFKKDMMACASHPFNDIDEEDTYYREMYEGIQLPVRATVGSAGHDFVSPIDFTLMPGETIKFPSGIRCEMNEDWVLMIYPRSSLGFKYRLQLDNGTGIIDSDFAFADNEGDIHMKLTNDSRDGKIVQIRAGDKIAQGVFVQYGVTIDDNAKGERNGGLGSTGR